MDAAVIAATLGEALPGLAVEAVPSIDLHATLYVDGARIIDVLRTLRDRDDLKFELLSEMTAVDVWPREPRFEVVYILVSFAHKSRVRLDRKSTRLNSSH